MERQVDFTYIHNKKCALFSYLENFLKDSSCHEQVEEEISRFGHDMAFHEFDYLQGLGKVNGE